MSYRKVEIEYTVTEKFSDVIEIDEQEYQDWVAKWFSHQEGTYDDMDILRQFIEVNIHDYASGDDPNSLNEDVELESAEWE